MKKRTTVDFMGSASHFFGLRFQWSQSKEQTKVHISQEAFADALIEQAGLSPMSATIASTPYRSEHPVDAITDSPPTDDHEAHKLEKEYRSLVGSLLWLAQGTRPDLATITNMLAQYQNRPTKQHLKAAKYVIKYVKGTKSRGITLSSTNTSSLHGHLHFPIHSNSIQGISDANWGPQDQSVPKQRIKYPS